MKKLLLLATLIVGVIAFSFPAQALTIVDEDSVTFQLDARFYEDEGGSDLKPKPDGDPWWLQAIFEDTTDGVLLTLEANLSGDNFVNDWYFNLDPQLNPLDLTFELQSGNTAPAADNILQDPDPSKNEYKADGTGGLFDIVFDFPEDDATRFEGQESIQYLITGAGLSASSFNFLSDGGYGGWHTAAKIQALSDPPGGSTWIGDGDGTPPIPEPTTILLVGLGLLGIAGLRKKLRK
jgi:hypothetical protein